MQESATPSPCPARSPRRSRLSLLVAATAAVLPLSALAATSTYVGSSANTSWNNASNWTPGIPAEGDDLVIADTTAQNALTLNDGPHAIGNLQHGATGTRNTNTFTVTSGGNASNVLTLNGGLTANGTNAGVFFLLNSPITVQGDQTWSVGGSSATGGSGSPTTDQGVSIANQANGTPVALTLNGKLTKTGAGQLLIIGRNVGDGSIDINAGAVKLNAGNSTPLTVGGSGTITVNGGASLYVARNSGTLNLTKAIQVNNGGTLSVGGNQGLTYDVASPVGFSGTTTLRHDSNTNNNQTRFTGNLTGTGTINVTSAGTGTGRSIILAGDNSGLSAQITNGTNLAIGSATALGTGIVRTETNSTLRSSDATARTIDNVIDLAANANFGATGTGDLTFTATGSATRSDGAVLTGIATGNGAKTLTINNARTTISGVITDGGGATANALTKAGPGILEFSGANTYNRPTVINAGTLLVSPGGRIGAATSTGLVTVADAGLLQLDAAGVSDAANLNVFSTDSAAEVALAAGVNDTINGLIINGAPMAPGTYGSSASGATNPGLAIAGLTADDIFSGTGVLTVTTLTAVPEPGTLGAAAVVAAGALTRRRRR